MCARQDVDSRRDCGHLSYEKSASRSIRGRSVGVLFKFLDEPGRRFADSVQRALLGAGLLEPHRRTRVRIQRVGITLAESRDELDVGVELPVEGRSGREVTSVAAGIQRREDHRDRQARGPAHGCARQAVHVITGSA